MSLLGTTRTKAQAKTDYSWIGGPIVGGVAALALVCGLGWYLYKKRQGTVAPTTFDAAHVPAPSPPLRYANGHQEAEAFSTTAPILSASLLLLLPSPFASYRVWQTPCTSVSGASVCRHSVAAAPTHFCCVFLLMCRRPSHELVLSFIRQSPKASTGQALDETGAGCTSLQRP